MTQPDDDTSDTGIDPQDGAESQETVSEWVAPSRDEWERTQAALKKANDEAKSHRLRLKDATKASEDDNAKAVREAGEQAAAKYKPVAVKAAARAEFISAGLADAASVAKLLRLLDMDAVEIDDDGEVNGLTEQVAAVKADFPSLFAKPAERRTPRVDTAGRSTSSGKSLTSGEIHAAAILGR